MELEEEPVFQWFTEALTKDFQVIITFFTHVIAEFAFIALNDFAVRSGAITNDEPGERQIFFIELDPVSNECRTMSLGSFNISEVEDLGFGATLVNKFEIEA